MKPLNIKIDSKEPIPAPPTPAEQLAEYEFIVENYKKQNPQKYELKKVAFEKKLAGLRAIVNPKKEEPKKEEPTPETEVAGTKTLGRTKPKFK
jgi:hypothetical protein